MCLSEKPKDSEVWCEEITKRPYGYFFKGSTFKCHVPDDWKQCPVCGAKKPEPVKTLEDKMMIAHKEMPQVIYSHPEKRIEAYCKVATEHFKQEKP